MFDRTFISTGPEEINITKTVHKHVPTTVKDVAKLNEVQEQLKSNIESVHRVEGNNWKGVVFIHHDISRHHYEARVVYELNGYERKIKIDLFKVSMVDRPAAWPVIAGYVRDAVIADLAEVITIATLDAARTSSETPISLRR